MQQQYNLILASDNLQIWSLESEILMILFAIKIK